MSEENKKKLKPQYIILIISLVILLLIYLCGVFRYRDSFFPGTFIDGKDYSGIKVQAADERRYAEDQSYTLSIKGRDGLAEIISAKEIGLKTSYSESMPELKKKQNAFLWPSSLFSDSSINLIKTVSYDQAMLDKRVAAIETFKNAKEPEDAHIGDYVEGSGAYSIVSENEGSAVDWERLIEALDTSIKNGIRDLDIDRAGCYKTPLVRSTDEGLLKELEKVNKYKDVVINYKYAEAVITIDFDEIHALIDASSNTVSVDAAKAAAFIDSFAEAHDTRGVSENFTTVSGDTILLPKGKNYGWEIDREAETAALIADIEKGGVTTREPFFSCTAWAGGEDDIGDDYVEVNMTKQKVYLINDGKVVFESDCVTGLMNKERATPEGIYGITYKRRNATLRGPGYESHVKYWMPFNRGVGLHDALWRGRFGGTIYIRNGSHGCVNLPLKSAETIYNSVEKGFPVICYFEPEKEEE